MVWNMFKVNNKDIDYIQIGFLLYHNEPHLQYKPPKHKRKEKFTALIQCKTRYKDPYLQPGECKDKNNNKLLNEKS